MRGVQTAATSGWWRSAAKARIGHRHRTTHAGFGLRHEEFESAVQNMAGLDAAPRRRCDAAIEAQRHQRMIGRMELYFVETPSIAVEILELRHIAVRLHGPFGDFCGTGAGTE